MGACGEIGSPRPSASRAAALPSLGTSGPSHPASGSVIHNPRRLSIAPGAESIGIAGGATKRRRPMHVDAWAVVASETVPSLRPSALEMTGSLCSRDPGTQLPAGVEKSRLLVGAVAGGAGAGGAGGAGAGAAGAGAAPGAAGAAGATSGAGGASSPGDGAGPGVIWPEVGAAWAAP